jgi:hypothetical protein
MWHEYSCYQESDHSVIASPSETMVQKCKFSGTKAI